MKREQEKPLILCISNTLNKLVFFDSVVSVSVLARIAQKLNFVICTFERFIEFGRPPAVAFNSHTINGIFENLATTRKSEVHKKKSEV